MPVEIKTERNRKIVELHLKDPKKYSLRALGRMLEISYDRTRTIFLRDKDKYGKS